MNKIRYSLIFVFLNYLRGGKLRFLRAAYMENDISRQTKGEKDETITK